MSNFISSRIFRAAVRWQSSGRRIQDGPGLGHFIQQSLAKEESQENGTSEDVQPLTNVGFGRSVHVETYGCQMNVSDTEVAQSVLKAAGYDISFNPNKADAVLLMTCAIREGAEQKIWNRLKELRAKRSRKGITVGVLGCMAERLKHKLLEEGGADLVCGPDAYRDLPRLLQDATAGLRGINVQLSLEETYADIVPVRLCQDAPSAYVSITRGCDNMCTYCIVPFTRGRERSRRLESVVEEVRRLAGEGVREVTLLGQNVNSYRDTSQLTAATPTVMAEGFNTIYKTKLGGRRFADLIDAVSRVDPEMRIRFTSPHPKDFPDEVLQLVAERANVCNALHLPAQSGSSACLQRMGRGYTREAYLALVERARALIPAISLSSDFISGFCGETEAEHAETLSLIEEVGYDTVFCFPYSQRKKTRAYHRLKDDVPEDVKKRRHQEMSALWRVVAKDKKQKRIGGRELVLVEGTSKRSKDDLVGRTDGNIRAVFKRTELPCGRTPQRGDYVEVEVTHTTSQTLLATPIKMSSIAEFMGEVEGFRPDTCRQ